MISVNIYDAHLLTESHLLVGLLQSSVQVRVMATTNSSHFLLQRETMGIFFSYLKLLTSKYCKWQRESARLKMFWFVLVQKLFKCEKGVYLFLADLYFLPNQANFWQTDLFWHEKHRSVIVLVDLCFVLQK